MWGLCILAPWGTGPVCADVESLGTSGFLCTGYILANWFGNKALGIFLSIPQWSLKDWEEGSLRRIKKARISESTEKSRVSHAVAAVCSSKEVERWESYMGFNQCLTPCLPALGGLCSGPLTTAHNHTIHTEHRCVFSEKQRNFHACAVREGSPPFPFWKQDQAYRAVRCPSRLHVMK